MKKYLALAFLLLTISCSTAKEQHEILVITNSLVVVQDGIKYIIWVGISDSSEDVGGIKVVEWWNRNKQVLTLGDIFTARKRITDTGWVLIKRLNAN